MPLLNTNATRDTLCLAMELMFVVPMESGKDPQVAIVSTFHVPTCFE